MVMTVKKMSHRMGPGKVDILLESRYDEKRITD